MFYKEMEKSKYSFHLQYLVMILALPWILFSLNCAIN